MNSDEKPNKRPARTRQKAARTGREIRCASHISSVRPILATVVSVFLTPDRARALFFLPVAQYPEIAPPTVQVTTVYPGASAEVVAQTVATPLEQQINGVEDMIYMSSQSTGDGKLMITVTFRIGTDLNVAQMLTQNCRTHCRACPRMCSASACRCGSRHRRSCSPCICIRPTRHATSSICRTMRPCTSRTR
jgi:HAE1 family hydrophobic/amphiphilic exporter-1